MTIKKSTLHLAAFATGFVAFVVYLFTLAPSVNFIDAGELSAVTHTFGIAHPTGYPLFTLIGGLWAHLPIGNSIFRMNVFSAFLCAIAVGVFVHLLWFFCGISERKKIVQKSKSRQKNGQIVKTIPQIKDDLRLVLAISGALVIGFSETFWSTALSIEVYSLHILMLSIVLYLFTTSIFGHHPDEKKALYRWIGFSFALGLSFTNHMTTILLAPAFLILFFWKFGFKNIAWKRIGIAIPSFIAGLLPYLYLPVRASSNPILNWGNPETLERFLWHISGKQYRVWIFSSTESAKKQLDYFLSSFPHEFAYIGLVFIVIGIVYSFLRHRQIGWMLILLFVGCVFYSINYDIHDIDSYFLLAYVTAGIWAMFGLLGLTAWFQKISSGAMIGIAAVVIGIILGAVWGNVSERDNYLVEDYTRNMFRSLKPNALVFSFQWDYWVSASYHYQYVDGIRPDVVVIDKELLRRSWYIEQIRNNHPEIYKRSEEEIKLFLEELAKFEHELPYNPEVIEKRYRDMINSIVEKNINDRPVYFTVEMENHLAPGYERIPEGLAFRLYKEASSPSLEQPVWDNFSFRDFSRSGRLIDAIRGMYANMLTNRGIYLNSYRKYKDAAGYFERALRFNPRDRSIHQWKERNEKAMLISSM